MKRIQNYINGQFESAESESWMDVYNPATGKKYAEIPNSNKTDIDAAIDAAAKAFPQWKALGAQTRSDYLYEISERILARKDELALAESIDNGKPLKLALRVDIPRAASNFKFFASAITQFSAAAHENLDHSINYTQHAPLGVVGCISPWNLPLYLLSWKIAPALAAGNTVVAKPSEVTPMTAYLLADICEEVGLPKGVLNVVHGDGTKAGSALVDHKGVKAISFTGSTRVGQHIAKTLAPSFKKVSLEMGGKNPNIIFADCDYEKMLKTTVHSSFSNQGQICLCGSRIFIQSEIYDKFRNDFIKKSQALTVGNPLNEKTKVGALVSKQHMDKVLSYIDLAKKEGGRIALGGSRVSLEGENQEGYFVAPTIIEGLDAYCRINKEEIFGPVVSLIPFDSEEEVTKWANNTEYGLSATIWTSDINKAHRMANNIESGMIWINTWMNRDLRTPFGGMKHSGVGREGGFYALQFFTETKNICIEYG